MFFIPNLKNLFIFKVDWHDKMLFDMQVINWLVLSLV